MYLSDYTQMKHGKRPNLQAAPSTIIRIKQVTLFCAGCWKSLEENFSLQALPGKKRQFPPSPTLISLHTINVFYQHYLMLHSVNCAWLMAIVSKRSVIPLLKKYWNLFQHQRLKDVLLTSTKRASAAEKTPASKLNGYFLCRGETQERKCLVTSATVHCSVLRAACDSCGEQQIASC